MASQTAKILLPAFEIDNRVSVKIEPELACALGRLILETDTINTALLALGHQLSSLSSAKSVDPLPQSEGDFDG